MRHLLSTAVFVACVASMALLVGVSTLGVRIHAQEESSTAALLDLLNDVRLGEGLDPYRESRLLTDAAQRHARDLAANGFADPENVHLGSDGSDEEERVRQAGYAAWTRDERPVVGEIVWAGHGGPEAALTALSRDPVEREKLFSETYREVGIGVASDADGRGIYVLDFGARPNVLPIFINDGAASTENREVAIRLTNERAYPEGSGTGRMGEAIEIRISDDAEFEGLPWQSWAPLVPWVLPDSVGEHTVYVEFRDAAGRTAASADHIFLDKGTPVTPTVIAGTPIAEATGSATSELTVTQVPPTPASSPEDGTAAPAPSPAASSEAPVVTPFPTWTPLPSEEPTPADLAPSQGADGLRSGTDGYGRLLAIVGALQGTALLLGVYLMMRRGGSGQRE